MSQFQRLRDGTILPDIETITGDAGGAVGPDAAFNINVLGNPDIEVAGTPATSTFQLTDLVKYTPYVVDAVVGAAPYSTIQSAIDAANAAGGGLILIRQGNYTEDLTLYDNIHLKAATTITDSAQVNITGTHTPPAIGIVSFNKINFYDDSAIFLSAAAGTTSFQCLNCNFYITVSGYVFDMPNWVAPGVFTVSNCGDLSTGDCGFVRNTAGASIEFINSYTGTGPTNSLIVSGDVFITLCDVGAPITIQGAATIDLEHVDLEDTLTTAGTATGRITNSTIISGANAAISHGSAGDLTVSQCVLESSNNPVIDGAGAGSLILQNNSFLDNAQIGAAVVTPNLNHEVRGTGSTIGAVNTDLITYTLPAAACSMVYDIRISGFESTTPAAAGYNIYGTTRTTGAAATLVGTPDKIVNEEAALNTADANLIVAGNTAIVRVTGVAALTINWNVTATFTQVR